MGFDCVTPFSCTFGALLMGNYHICHLYFWSYCIHQDINLYHHCVALCSEELSGRITDSCYFCGEWASQGTLENHNTK